MFIIGSDPGGDKANGIAWLEISDQGAHFETATVSSVDEVLRWLEERRLGKQVEAAGIDTLLSWSIGTAGLRPMDLELRHRYPAVKNSVMAPNSLYGAMPIQGMALAMKLRQAMPDIRLNETHPKVQYFALAERRYDFGDAMIQWIREQFPANTQGSAIQNDHEWDALFSAWVTWKGIHCHWDDLAAPGEGLLFPVPGTTYLWPHRPAHLPSRPSLPAL